MVLWYNTNKSHSAILLLLCFKLFTPITPGHSSVIAFIQPLTTTTTKGFVTHTKIEDPISSNYYFRSRLLLLSTAKQEHEIEIFRNRTELTQIILKEKLEEIKLLNSKISVLQDVLIRKQEKQKEGFDNALNQKECEYQSRLENIREEAGKNLENEVSKQKKKAADRLQHEMQQNQEESQRAALKRGRQVNALKNEVLDMDEALETAQGKLAKLEQLVVVRERKICELEEEALKNSEQLVRGADIENKEIQALNRELQSARSNSANAERMRQETIEIAEAAVQAVERREKELARKVEQLKEEVGIKSHYADPVQLKSEISQLKQDLRDRKISYVGERNADRERFAAELDSERKIHQIELERLQSKLMLQEKRQDSLSKEGGKIRGIWKRLRRPFKRNN